MKVDGCLLCALEKLTPWYYETEEFVVVECNRCHVPMYVWRDHYFPSEEEVSLMVNDAKKRFPEWNLDFRRKSLPSHFHFHLRRAIDTTALEAGGKLLGDQKALR